MQLLADQISKALKTRPFSGSLRFDCGEAGSLVIADGAAFVGDQATDCTITITQDHLRSLLAGKLNPMMAMATGKLRVSGNPAVALNLAKLLG